ncbi:hypothetical protein Y032_0006g2895 [Ancylostoma ceylanicum]|uniref:Tc1-like transposase DDE domain-containing protein n=1 Tax=Ancylostoma ceylanicum TaxID=53326 RepID=A0A016VQG8_9BILA|nr:hypothetical protein Y032_0006g2895 [Ancylostoma ceylanicum]
MDEKYCSYDNTVRRKQWVDFEDLPKPRPKREQHEKKELLSFWWDISGPVFWELVPTGSMVDSDLFCTQLEKVAGILRCRHSEREKILLLIDNARPHISKKSYEKLTALGIDLVPHPPYSPDLAPSDYHVFRSTQKFFAGKKFKDKAEVKRGVDDFLSSKSSDFSPAGSALFQIDGATWSNTMGDYKID